jgi:hypothetical protein
MPPVPVLRPAEVVKAFQKLGDVTRHRGSHIIMTNLVISQLFRYPNILKSRAEPFEYSFPWPGSP